MNSPEYPDTWPDAFDAFMEKRGMPRDGDRGISGAWFVTSPGVKRLFSYVKEFEKFTEESKQGAVEVPFGFVKGGVNHFASGESRWLDHGGGSKCIEDFADPVARQKWPRYYVERDKSGAIIHEGPEPFRSDEERLTYEREFGFTSCGAGDLRPENPYKREFEKYPELRAQFPEFANWGKRGRPIDESDLRQEVVHAEADEEEW